VTSRAARDGLVADSPAFGCYLAALAVLPLRWLSPIGSVYENADWTDIFVALAAALWLIEKLRDRELPHALRRWQLPVLATSSSRACPRQSPCRVAGAAGRPCC
jgi:hypothetical protein